MHTFFFQMLVKNTNREGIFKNPSWRWIQKWQGSRIGDDNSKWFVEWLCGHAATLILPCRPFVELSRVFTSSPKPSCLFMCQNHMVPVRLFASRTRCTVVFSNQLKKIESNRTRSNHFLFENDRKIVRF